MAFHFAYSPFIGCGLFILGSIQPFDWLWLFTLHTALLLAVAVYLGYIQPFYFNRSVVSFGSGSQVVPSLAPPPAPVIGGSCHKYLFGRNKSFVVTNTCLSRQNMSFVATNIILSRQRFCCNKLTFVATKHPLLWQKYACHNKPFFHNKHVFLSQQIFVTTKHLLRQKAYSCGNKRHVLSRQTQACLSWQNFRRCKNYTSGSSHQW